MSQIIIGYTTEGTTDIRFLSSIIQRTFVEIGFECVMEIEILEPIIYIPKSKNNTFINQILTCSEEAHNNGVMAFCVHVDADSNNDSDVLQTRIDPLLQEIEINISKICKNIVPIIPVQMTEAWMLADKQLLKDEIGVPASSDAHLGLHRAPETIADPKAIITEAIRIAREPMVRRRRKDLTISELYQPIGQKMSLEMLDALPSYLKFKESVRSAYRKLNYLQ